MGSGSGSGSGSRIRLGIRRRGAASARQSCPSALQPSRLAAHWRDETSSDSLSGGPRMPHSYENTIQLVDFNHPRIIMVPARRPSGMVSTVLRPANFSGLENRMTAQPPPPGYPPQQPAGASAEELLGVVDPGDVVLLSPIRDRRDRQVQPGQRFVGAGPLRRGAGVRRQCQEVGASGRSSSGLIADVVVYRGQPWRRMNSNTKRGGHAVSRVLEPGWLRDGRDPPGGPRR